MKKIPVNFILYLIMFLAAGILVLSVSHRSTQAAMSLPMPVYFTGEYSQDGGEWQSFDTDTELSAYDGDVVLRGRFPGTEDAEGIALRFYLNHIGLEIYRDGELLYESSVEKYEGMCAGAWVAWELPELSSEDILEIHLNDPHHFGNRNAYNQFLDSIYTGSDMAMKDYFEKKSMPYRAAGAFILVASIALIGTAIGYLLLHLYEGGLLIKSGILSLMMGAYMYVDAREMSLWDGQMEVNTYVCRLAMMTASWLFCMCVAELLHGKRKKAAKIAGYVLMITDFALMAGSLVTGKEIYDTGSCWAVVQAVVNLLLLILTAVEIKNSERGIEPLKVSVIVLLIVLLMEIANACMGWWQEGICIKIVFTVLFVFHLARGAWRMAKNHQESIRAKKLAQELKNSRIVLAMSQIRTHFVFNVLNAISGMCAYDPQKADETLVMFSHYLRNNINIMEEDKLESFTRSLECLEEYVFLEQVRFGEKLRFEKNIESDNFQIPPLVLQPLVENAIRHGLSHKKQGGTVSLHTWDENGDHFIEISDDGVGFDTADEPGEESVGMKNVRFRLKYMAGGTMDVQSTPGHGTTVTIIIPGRQKQ